MQVLVKAVHKDRPYIIPKLMDLLLKFENGVANNSTLFKLRVFPKVPGDLLLTV